MVERSAEGNAAEVADEMSQDSKAEKRIDVENPPSRRPMNRMGVERIITHAQERVYVMQKTRHSFLLPLFDLGHNAVGYRETKLDAYCWSAHAPTKGAARPADKNPVTKKTATILSGNPYCSLYNEYTYGPCSQSAPDR